MRRQLSWAAAVCLSATPLIVSAQTAEPEDDVLEGQAFVPPGDPVDTEGTAIVPAMPAAEDDAKGVAQTPEGIDGELPYNDPPDPSEPIVPMDSPDLEPGQLLQLYLLESSSLRPLRHAFGSSHRVPIALRGQWVRSEPDPVSAAQAFVMEQYPLLRLDPIVDSLQLVSVRSRRFDTVRFEQTYQGLDVFGADLLVNLRDEAQGRSVRMMHGTVVPEVSVGTNPLVPSHEAEETARTYTLFQVSQGAVVQTSPAVLGVYDVAVFDALQDSDPRLAWRVDVELAEGRGRWRVFVDAQGGSALWGYDRLATSHPSRSISARLTPWLSDDIEWFTDGVQVAAGTPGTEVADLDTFGHNYHDWLLSTYGVDSLDDGGMRMVGRVRTPAIMGANAFWTGTETRYTPGMATQDIVGHEFTHGLVQNLAGGLTYSYQSGALNESHADLFGEMLDCKTGLCNWAVGADSFGNTGTLGIIRSVANPSTYGDPDHWEDFVRTSSDNGGVHTNSGIINKMGHLLSAGGTQRGIFVFGLGVDKAGLIILEALIDTGLSSSASFVEYSEVIQETCDALIGTAVGAGTPVSPTDCRSVHDALCAVGLQCPLTQTTAPAAPERNDQFGWSLASGDFDGDGFDDLAIGTPYEDHSGSNDTGLVSVFYGSASGLTSDGADRITQETAGTTSEGNDRFGWSLAAGDFDGDGFDDLVVGTPYEHLGSTRDAGWIFTFYGRGAGLVDASGRTRFERISQASCGTARERDDRFGWSLASGDINGDGRDDLVVGSPDEDLGSINQAGWIFALYGQPGGLRSGGTTTFERLSQSAFGQTREADDRFGYALAVGDIDGDGFDDVIATAPYEHIGSIRDAGIIAVALGTGAGLISGGAVAFETLSQLSASTSRETNDRFGYSVALGDFTGDGRADALVGTPEEDLGSINDAGWVITFRGTVNGLRSGGSTIFQRISQSSLNGAREANDHFGYAVSLGDLDGDGRADAVIGAPDEDLSAGNNTGRVHRLGGGVGGLLIEPSANVFPIDQDDVSGVAEANDEFGFSVLATGDFDGDGDTEAAIGAPSETIFRNDDGAVYLHE